MLKLSYGSLFIPLRKAIQIKIALVAAAFVSRMFTVPEAVLSMKTGGQ